MRYYMKIIDMEKEVLSKFFQATNGRVRTRYRVNLTPSQTKPPKCNEAKRKLKKKNKRKHSSQKMKHSTSQNGTLHQTEGNVGNRAHYVSKIVVDDNTRSLKLSFKPCTPRKSSSTNELKENDGAEKYKERVRSRKSKQPRRVYRTSEDQPELQTTLRNERTTDTVAKSSEDQLETMAPVQLPSVLKKPLSTSTCSEEEHQNCSPVSTKTETNRSGCLFASNNPNDKQSEQLPSSTHSNGEELHSKEPFANSDDEQSDCSEEFSIVESRETDNDKLISAEDTKMPLNDDDAVREKLSNGRAMKKELMKRLKATLIRKQADNNQHCEAGSTNKGLHTNDANVDENAGLPQVVSVHFFDPQNQCQRVIDPNTHITQYERSDGTHLMLNHPTPPSSSLLPPVHPVGINSAGSFDVKTPLSPLQRLSPPVISPSAHSLPAQTSVPSTSYSYPQHNQYLSGINQQSPAAVFANGPCNASQASLQKPDASYPTPGISSKISANAGESPPVALTDNISGTVSSSINRQVKTVSDDEMQENRESWNVAGSRGVQSETRSRKRQRFIFESHEPPRKKVISSLLTPLCEREATRLADGIHEINMQYFPLRSLAQKAANRVSEDTDDVLKLIEQKIQLKTKVQDVEKARNLLKDIYDMVLKSKEIEDIQNFELVSHNFGVRNILNHLSLVDLYFGELGTELQSKI